MTILLLSFMRLLLSAYFTFACNLITVNIIIPNYTSIMSKFEFIYKIRCADLYSVFLKIIKIIRNILTPQIFDLSDFLSGRRYLYRLNQDLNFAFCVYRLSGMDIVIPGDKSDASISFILQISKTALLVSVSSDLYVLAISHNVSP